MRALHRELVCYPKPGLVSRIDNGSHDDMTAATFMRSLFSLRHYFCQMALASASRTPFTLLRTLGLEAEQRMARATGGANTHRGAIFSLGLLAAAAGRLLRAGHTISGCALGNTVRHNWGDAIRASATASAPASHGLLMTARYRVGGARSEAAAGFPHVFDVGLPALVTELRNSNDIDRAMVHCFFNLMTTLPDTNLLYRGGGGGLRFAQSAANEFLARGGTARADWRKQAIAIHRAFVARRLSPGGSADLLAATVFVHLLQRTYPT